MRIARLENWCKVERPVPNEFLLLPEYSTTRLHGNVFGHPGHDDGTEITTSPIVGKSGERIVTSSGTSYELGTVNSEYERQFPDAKQRLISAMPEVTR